MVGYRRATAECFAGATGGVFAFSAPYGRSQCSSGRVRDSSVPKVTLVLDDNDRSPTPPST